MVSKQLLGKTCRNWNKSPTNRKGKKENKKEKNNPKESTEQIKT